MAEQESQAAEQVRQLFVRNQKQMTTMSVVSWSLAIVALTVAGYVAVSVVDNIINQIPEPSMLGVVALAGGGLLFRRRR